MNIIEDGQSISYAWFLQKMGLKVPLKEKNIKTRKINNDGSALYPQQNTYIGDYLYRDNYLRDQWYQFLNC